MGKLKSLPLNFSICGIDELSKFCSCGISHVLSILDPGFPEPDVFRSFAKHERFELRFHDIIDEREGRIAPQKLDVELLLRFGKVIIERGHPTAHLLVHCHAGVSRSTAAMTLLLSQANPEWPPETVVSQVVGVRPNAWPNLRMIEIGDSILDCKGQLVCAVRAQYADMIARNPEFGRILIAGGRCRDVLSAQVAAHSSRPQTKGGHGSQT
jgi:predicted protein tyrosine phosphatase